MLYLIVKLNSMLSNTPNSSEFLGYQNNNFESLSTKINSTQGVQKFSHYTNTTYNTGNAPYSLNDLVIWFSTGIQHSSDFNAVASNSTYSPGAFSGWSMAQNWNSSLDNKTLLFKAKISTETYSGSSWSIQWHAGTSPTSANPIGPRAYLDEESSALCLGLHTQTSTNRYVFLKCVALSGTIDVMTGLNYRLANWSVRVIS